MRRILLRSLAALAVAGFAVAAMPSPANAWWRGGIAIGLPPIYLAPPVYVAPAPVYAPASVYPPGPVYYAPSPAYYSPAPVYRRVWVPGFWNRGVWVGGHERWR